MTIMGMILTFYEGWTDNEMPISTFFVFSSLTSKLNTLDFETLINISFRLLTLYQHYARNGRTFLFHEIIVCCPVRVDLLSNNNMTTWLLQVLVYRNTVGVTVTVSITVSVVIIDQTWLC